MVFMMVDRYKTICNFYFIKFYSQKANLTKIHHTPNSQQKNTTSPIKPNTLSLHTVKKCNLEVIGCYSQL